MAFTGKLGSSNSQLGSFVLGLGATAWSNTLSIDGIAATTPTNVIRMSPTFTIPGIAAVTPTNVMLIPLSISVDGIAAIAFSTTFVGASLSIDGIAAVSASSLMSMVSTISVDGVATISLATTMNMLSSLSVDGISAMTENLSVGGFKTVSIDGISSVTLAPGFNYSLTLSIDGTAALTIVAGFRFITTVSIDGIAIIDETDVLRITKTLTIAGISAVARAAFQAFFKTVTIAGISTFFSPGGVVLFNNCPIEGFATCDVLPGWGYFDTLSIDSVATITEVELYVKQLALAIDGIAAVDTAAKYIANVRQTIAGISATTITTTAIFYHSIQLDAIGALYRENFYDNLYISAAVATITVAYQLQRGVTENPHGIAGFSASSQCIFARHVTQTLALHQTATQKPSKKVTVQSFALTQTATFIKTHNPSAENTLILTDAANAWRPTQTGLTLTQTATAKRIRFLSVTHTLGLNQTLSRNTVLNLATSNTLIFNPPNIKRVQGRFTVQIPSAYASMIPRKCLVVLGVPTQTILLPCPQFNDSVAFQGTLDLKRSMVGSTYTVIKNTTLQKLKYDFWLWTNKYLELRNFLLAHSAEIMTLINWKGETWLVTIANNPIQLTAEERFQPKGERYSVTLEFEGIRIGGQT